jgi:hypothetical protein
MKRLRFLAVLCGLAFIAVLAVNWLSERLPLNGTTAAAVYAAYPNLFAPSAFAFGVWGLIYLCLAVYLVAACREAFGSKPDRPYYWDAGDGSLFFFALLCNAGWVFAWHWSRIGLALAASASLFVTLAIMASRNQRRMIATRDGGGGLRRIVLSVPLEIYCGWMAATTAGNLIAFLVALGLDGSGRLGRIAAFAGVGLTLALAISALARQGSMAFALAVAWAFFGILSRRLDEGPADAWPIAVLAAAGIGVILIGVLIRAIALAVKLGRRGRRPPAPAASSS